MYERFRQLLGRAPSTSAEDDVPNVEVEPRDLSETRLATLLGSTLRLLEGDAKFRGEFGQPIGRIAEVRDAQGTTVDYRCHRYGSMLEAGCDHRLAQIEQRDGTDSPTVREIHALWGHVERRALLDALEALGDVTPPENAPQRPQRPLFEASLTLDAHGCAGQAVRDVRRAAAEREMRSFEDRQAAREAEVRHTGFNDFGERVRLLDELNRWSEAHPELQDAISASEDERGRR